MRRQDWSQLVSISALVGALALLLRGRRRSALLSLAAALAGDAAARRWSRGEPTPLPYSLRWLLAIPRPDGPLKRALEPREGERILEVGPGLGQHAVAIAGCVGAHGRVDVVDVQQEMLDATAARAERNGVHNVVGSRADPFGALPYEEGCFDAAYMVSVLGEIPDHKRILAELHRARRHARLVARGGRCGALRLAGA